MHIGTQLMTFGSGAQEYYTPWFPKGADNAYFTYELVRQNLGTTGSSFTVACYTKNREDAGSEGTTVSLTWGQMGSTGAASGFWQASATNLRQLVRFKITINPGSGGTGQLGVVYRFLPPTWYDKAV